MMHLASHPDSCPVIIQYIGYLGGSFVAGTDEPNIGIDTPADLELAEKYLVGL